MQITDEAIKSVAEGISNCVYWNNLQAVKELMELFNKIARKELKTPDDYIDMYDDCFYTYQSWKALVESEKDQSDGLTEDELKRELEDNEHGSVWQLPCGWYVQYV